MSNFDDEVMWAVSGTGDDFQCVHVDFAREQQAEIERLRAALEDIQREAMTFKPPRHNWYYDRAQNALTNSNEPLVRDGLAPPPSRT